MIVSGAWLQETESQGNNHVQAYAMLVLSGGQRALCRGFRKVPKERELMNLAWTKAACGKEAPWDQKYGVDKDRGRPSGVSQVEAGEGLEDLVDSVSDNRCSGFLKSGLLRRDAHFTGEQKAVSSPQSGQGTCPAQGLPLPAALGESLSRMLQLLPSQQI